MESTKKAMIKSLHIENFKSIENQTVNFDEFSMIIGENASGKTNLINAISFVRRIVLGSNVSEAHKMFAATPSELLNKRSHTNVIKVSILLGDGDEAEYHLSYEFSLVDSPSSLKVLSISYEKLEVKNENKTEVVLERRGDSIISAGTVIPTNLKIESGIPAMAVVDNPSIQKVRRLFNRIYISTADVSVSTAKQPHTLEQRVIEIISLLKKKSTEDFRKFEVVVKKLMPSLSSIVDVSEGVPAPLNSINEYQFLFKEKNMEGALSLKAGSHGDLRTFYILALTFLAGENSTIIAEEIENGIHTKRAKDLIEFLEKISYQGNKQLILSSHNPRLIGKVPFEKLIIVERSADGASTYKKFTTSANLPALERFLEQGGDIAQLL